MILKSVVSPIKWNIEKSTTENTEGELYLRIGKRGIMINWGSGKIISLKKNTFLRVWLVTKSNTNLCPIKAATGVLYKKVILKILRCSQDNTRVGVSFLTKLQACNLRFQHRSCPVNFAKYLWTRFLQNTGGQLLVVLRSRFDLLCKSCSFLCSVLEFESEKNVLYCLGSLSKTNYLRLNT